MTTFGYCQKRNRYIHIFVFRLLTAKDPNYFEKLLLLSHPSIAAVECKSKKKLDKIPILNPFKETNTKPFTRISVPIEDNLPRKDQHVNGCDHMNINETSERLKQILLEQTENGIDGVRSPPRYITVR